MKHLVAIVVIWVFFLTLLPNGTAETKGFEGKIATLRVNEVGVAYGPPRDRLEAEIIVTLKEHPENALGFTLRADRDRAVHEGNLKLLRDAFAGDITVNLLCSFKPENDNGIIKRIELAPYRDIKHVVGRHNLLILLIDPALPDHMVPRDEYREIIERVMFNDNRNVQNYFLENSNDRLIVENSGILGWYELENPWDYYWQSGGHTKRWKEVITKASEDIDFKQFDSNNDDKLQPGELAIMLLQPTFPTPEVWGGRVRTITGSFRVDGVLISKMLEVGFSNTEENLGVIAHELTHLLSNAEVEDMYFDGGFYYPFAADDYSLMDNHSNNPHLDPFWKIKLGWIEPRIISREGRYRIRNVQQHNDILKLYNTKRPFAQSEYFLIENRWPGNSYDEQLPDRGLAIWHVIEDPSKQIPQQALDILQNDKHEVARQYWTNANKTRRGVRLIRPFLDDTHSDHRDLWDGSEINQNRVSLKWADGTASGFSIRDISSAGSTMTVYIDVP